MYVINETLASEMAMHAYPRSSIQNPFKIGHGRTKTFELPNRSCAQHFANLAMDEIVTQLVFFFVNIVLYCMYTLFLFVKCEQPL